MFWFLTLNSGSVWLLAYICIHNAASHIWFSVTSTVILKHSRLPFGLNKDHMFALGNSSSVSQSGKGQQRKTGQEWSTSLHPRSNHTEDDMTSDWWHYTVCVLGAAVPLQQCIYSGGAGAWIFAGDDYSWTAELWVVFLVQVQARLNKKKREVKGLLSHISIF